MESVSNVKVKRELGDIRRELMAGTFYRIAGYGGMWLMGLFGIAFFSHHLQQQILQRAAAEHRLQEAHDLLEQRVAERTAELAKANNDLQSEVADRRQAEHWLLESEQRFRGFFEQGLIGMAILSADYEWVEVNQRLCRMLGYAEEELLPKTWKDVSHPDDQQADETQFQRILAGESRGFILDKRLRRKDGQTFQAGLSVQCMKKSDGAIDCFLVLVRDRNH